MKSATNPLDLAMIASRRQPNDDRRYHGTLGGALHNLRHVEELDDPQTQRLVQAAVEALEAAQARMQALGESSVIVYSLSCTVDREIDGNTVECDSFFNSAPDANGDEYLATAYTLGWRVEVVRDSYGQGRVLAGCPGCVMAGRWRR